MPLFSALIKPVVSENVCFAHSRRSVRSIRRSSRSDNF